MQPFVAVLNKVGAAFKNFRQIKGSWICPLDKDSVLPVVLPVPCLLFFPRLYLFQVNLPPSIGSAPSLRLYGAPIATIDIGSTITM